MMPDGSKLGEAKLRGVTSSGMILAEDEVGHRRPGTRGSWCCPATWRPARRSHEHLPIVDEVLELEITPNRPDCLAVYGVAREVHAATGAPLAEDPAESDAEPSGPMAPRTTPPSRSPTPTSACASPPACSRT